MNRKERRAQKVAERKAKRAGKPPPAPKGELPQHYYDHIYKLARLASEWYSAQDPKPDLRWVEQKDDGVLITGNLDVAAKYLADSPDAFRLLAWLAEKTNREISLYQATWALRLIRAIPMPDGSWYGIETAFASPAQQMLAGFGAQMRKGQPSRFAPTACGHCGHPMDAADSEDGRPPKPGDLTLCILCGGFNQFGDDLGLTGRSVEEVEALTGEEWPHFKELHESFRQILMRMAADKLRGASAERAEA